MVRGGLGLAGNLASRRQCCRGPARWGAAENAINFRYRAGVTGALWVCRDEPGGALAIGLGSRRNRANSRRTEWRPPPSAAVSSG